jgi:lipoprotein-anchoring transpeptidase ErfK/SrfK
MSRRTLAAAGLGAVAACAVAGTASLLLGGVDGPVEPRRAVLPPPPKPALHVPAPRALGDDARAAVWTYLLRGVTARAQPRYDARPVSRLARRTPEGSANTVLVIGDRARDARGRLWVRARLPVLPNGTTGWLPRSALGAYEAVSTRLVVDRRQLTATLLRDGRRVFRAGVGIGQRRWPTPRGHFYIRNRLTRYRSATYGPLAFGTCARSERLTDWPAGGYVGIHGTNRPGLLPGRVSHGCIRMRNRDILRLGRLMSVGTPVTIR